MSPVTHFLTGWMLANVDGLKRPERAVVTIAAVIPDIDGLGAIPEVLTRHSAHPLLWFSRYHHQLHNLGFAIVTFGLAFAIARTCRSAGLAFVAFHLHLLCDLAGARGPDGDQWPISYLMPFSDRWQWAWSGQWALNAWPNFVITAALLIATLYLAWERGFSPLEFVSRRADAAFVETLRRRFPRRQAT